LGSRKDAIHGSTDFDEQLNAFIYEGSHPDSNETAKALDHGRAAGGLSHRLRVTKDCPADCLDFLERLAAALEAVPEVAARTQ
jgi:hypothetical protein